MKIMTKYNLKRGLVILGLTALPLVFGGCEKEDTKPNNNGGNNQPQQKTEEFIYNANLKFYRHGSSEKISNKAFRDTVAALASRQDVGKIHITPDHEDLFSTFNEDQMVVRANLLDTIYDRSNQKLSGDNTTLVLEQVAMQNSHVQSVLHNKLKIELKQKSN